MSKSGRDRAAGPPRECPTCGKWIRRLEKHIAQMHPVIAMYGRLAKAYMAHPAVPDLGGGVAGDLNPF